MEGRREIAKGCACAAACETLFGFSYLFTKDAMGSASELALLGWRFLIAALAIAACALLGIARLKLRGKSMRPLLSIALFSPVLYFIGETLGISST